jgi:cytochrome c oxidase cbb3-type subunit 1
MNLIRRNEVFLSLFCLRHGFYSAGIATVEGLSMSTATIGQAYNYKVVRQFVIATVIWGVVGMAMGVWIASQLVWPEMNLDLPWTTFGRLRPLHTSLVIFGFAGSAQFAASYYAVQRTCQVRLFSDKLAAFTFWGWQSVIVIMLISLPLGYTTTKEYAEIEFSGAVWMTVVWVAYAIVFFTTVVQRKTRHIYVGNWFFGAFIVVIAMLHVVNHLSIRWTGSSPIRCIPGPPMPWCSGGTGTTPWVSS